MEPVFFVLAIMGCGDAATACGEARVEPARFATMRQCQAAMPAALMRNTDLSYPVVSAACRGGATRMAAKDAKPRV